MSFVFSLDHSTLQMMSFHSETTQHYNETMQNLKIINDTIAYLLQVTWHNVAPHMVFRSNVIEVTKGNILIFKSKTSYFS